MGFVNRNVENTNRKVLKVLETSKQNNEITELVVEEYKYEGEVYSEGTPLEANSFETIVQEVIDNDLVVKVMQKATRYVPWVLEPRHKGRLVGRKDIY